MGQDCHGLVFVPAVWVDLDRASPLPEPGFRVVACEEKKGGGDGTGCICAASLYSWCCRCSCRNASTRRRALREPCLFDHHQRHHQQAPLENSRQWKFYLLIHSNPKKHKQKPRPAKPSANKAADGAHSAHSTKRDLRVVGITLSPPLPCFFAPSPLPVSQLAYQQLAVVLASN